MFGNVTVVECRLDGAGEVC